MTSVRLDMRVHPDDLAEINRQAQERGISRTRFLVDSALRRLPEHRDAIEQDVHELKKTVARLENLASLGT